MSRSREPAIVHVDTETIRAKLGVDELYEKPSIVSATIDCILATTITFRRYKADFRRYQPVMPYLKLRRVLEMVLAMTLGKDGL